jgi:hypothetical protein
MRSHLLAAALLAAGCRSGVDYADREDIFAATGDHGVLCAASLEWQHADRHVIDRALDRARDQHEVLQLFAHDPGGTVDVARIEQALADAEARGLRSLTYRELAGGVPPEGGVAVSFDDWYEDDWYALRDVLARHGARVTFFVALYPQLSDRAKQELHELAALGHDIEYHSTHHYNAENYASAHGADAYITDDILPALEAMRADGYDPHIFAYPFGARTTATDDALRPLFHHIRAIYSTCPY